VEGRIGVYVARGIYQLYARRIVPAGSGAQARAKMELQERLAREGLFDPRHKRPLPSWPMRVALVTSPTGAAVRDVLKVSRKRFPACAILVVPAVVQGFEAPESIVRALGIAGSASGVEAVLLVRGGGSRDDLAAFNDERIVRALRSCPVPVVTGVGHEVDQSLADLAADVACPTPSAAAERVFPDRHALVAQLALQRRNLCRSVERRIEGRKQLLNQLRHRMTMAVSRGAIAEAEARVARTFRELRGWISQGIMRAESRLGELAAALDVLSPLSVLARGFISCEDEGGRPVISGAVLRRGDSVRLCFIDGKIGAEVTEEMRRHTPGPGKE
jgi:exodeoxyribonuclease VII large subunit